MSVIVLDAATILKLRADGTSVKISDREGNIVGTFFPVQPNELAEGEVPDIPEEELQRREARWQGLTSDEVLQRLRSRR